jgi:hypothetical protein
MTERFQDNLDQSDEKDDYTDSADLDAPTEEISLDELEELLGPGRDLAMEDIVDTQHGDGHTYNPHLAQDQGLVYTPPDDPPVLPSGDGQGARVAAGFSQSMEESNPDVVDLPARVDNNDLDLEEDIYVALQNNSETSHLADLHVRVRNGIAYIRGLVESEDDIARVADVVAYLDGVRDVITELEVAQTSTFLKTSRKADSATATD